MQTSVEQGEILKTKAVSLGVDIPGLDTDISLTSTPASHHKDSLAEPSPD